MNTRPNLWGSFVMQKVVKTRANLCTRPIFFGLNTATNDQGVLAYTKNAENQ